MALLAEEDNWLLGNTVEELRKLGKEAEAGAQAAEALPHDGLAPGSRPARIRGGLDPPPQVIVAEWADENRKVSPESS